MKEIRRAVVAGTLKPGDIPTEASLSSILNVSRPTVREALAHLAQSGLLVQEPYRGLRVATLGPAEMLDVTKARRALDILAAASVLEDPTGRRLAMVESAWDTYSRSASHVDPVVIHEVHVAFHRSLWVASENAALLRFWPVVEAHLTIALTQDLGVREDSSLAHEVHEQLVHSMRLADMEAIEAAYSVHTIDSAERLATLLKQKKETA